jgi:hypothetical protein
VIVWNKGKRGFSMSGRSSGALRAGICLAAVLLVSACGENRNLNPFRGGITAGDGVNSTSRLQGRDTSVQPRQSTLGDLFTSPDENVTIEVNKYIWNASLDILNFLPVQAADPFTGVIVTGFGTPPGGGTAYRATVYIRDPALEARSLNVALATRSGPVPAATVRAIEDAILTRARQLRQVDLSL